MIDERTRRWTAVGGRFGLVACGVVYCLVALVALAVARGQRGGAVEEQGALELVASHAWGTALLSLLTLGFLGYAAWRFLRAAVGAGEGTGDRSGPTGALKRGSDLVTALVYLSFAAATVRIISRGNAGSNSNEHAQSLSARLLEAPGGRGLVTVAGVAFVAVGVGLVVYALQGQHERHLDTAGMSRWQRRWLPRLGTAGHLARAAVAVLVGVFVVQAALAEDPDRATGMDGALRRLAETQYGPSLLIAVALGLFAYGLYSFVEARWRKVLE